MTDSIKIGAMVRFHRKKAKITQYKLAQLAGVGKTAVFDVEHGKGSVQYSTLRKIFAVLNIQIRFEGPLMKEYHEKS